MWPGRRVQAFVKLGGASRGFGKPLLLVFVGIYKAMSAEVKKLNTDKPFLS
jgi:hypothetical protein